MRSISDDFIAVMKFIVKLFPEIIIKSEPVRREFTHQLHNDLNIVLKRVDPRIRIIRE